MTWFSRLHEAKLPVQLTPEVRAFIKEGKVACIHPFWTLKGVFRLMGGEGEPDIDSAEFLEASHLFNKIVKALDMKAARDLAAQVATVFAGDGAWSVDMLRTQAGFVVVGMNPASEVFHWEACPHKNSFTPPTQG
jgi:hypothetical protein